MTDQQGMSNDNICQIMSLLRSTYSKASLFHSEILTSSDLICCNFSLNCTDAAIRLSHYFQHKQRRSHLNAFTLSVILTSPTYSYVSTDNHMNSYYTFFRFLLDVFNWITLAPFLTHSIANISTFLYYFNSLLNL